MAASITLRCREGATGSSPFLSLPKKKVARHWNTMKAILNRLRWLEKAAVPDEREHAVAEAILEAKRRSLGAD